MNTESRLTGGLGKTLVCVASLVLPGGCNFCGGSVERTKQSQAMSNVSLTSQALYTSSVVSHAARAELRSWF